VVSVLYRKGKPLLRPEEKNPTAWYGKGKRSSLPSTGRGGIHPLNLKQELWIFLNRRKGGEKKGFLAKTIREGGPSLIQGEWGEEKKAV